MLDPDVSPYCFDLDARKLFCVSTPDIKGATFFYQAQRQRARSVIKVPFDALPEAPLSPTLIFSIGRCGSTLLHKAFEAAGVRTVSEPDYFTQAALRRPHDPALRSVIGRATQLLPYSVIKLRAECNNAALLIAGGFRAPKVMFVLRDPVEWAASARRVSRDASPGGIAALLRALLVGLDSLTRHYDVRICYTKLPDSYGASVPPPAGMDGQRWVSRPRRPVLRRQGRAGGKHPFGVIEQIPDDPFREAFRHEWGKARPAAMIENSSGAPLIPCEPSMPPVPP